MGARNKSKKMQIYFQNIGWKSKISQKRVTLSISINKLVVVGCDLEKGKDLYSYIAEDKQGRPIMITYLDGKKRD